MANANDLYQLKIFCSHGDQTAINVLHFVASTKAGTGATDTEIASAFNAQVATEVKALISQQATFRGVSARRIEPVPLGIEVVNTSQQGVGTVASDLMPKQTCGLITLVTGFAGKRYRGRVYVPFPGVSDNDSGGVPTAAYITRLSALATLLDQSFTAGAAGNTNTMQPVVRSKKYGLKTNVLSTIQRTKWATQRRRGAFGRANPPPF